MIQIDGKKFQPEPNYIRFLQPAHRLSPSKSRAVKGATG